MRKAGEVPVDVAEEISRERNVERGVVEQLTLSAELPKVVVVLRPDVFEQHLRLRDALHQILLCGKQKKFHD